MLKTLWPPARMALLAAALTAGCASAPVLLDKRAIVDVPDIELAISRANEVGAGSGQTPPSGTPWFVVHQGVSPAIVTAPHATRPFREGAYRFSDGPGTAAMARALHTICGVTVIHTTFDSPSDPNFYDDNEFKATLSRLIESVRPVVVLDIHASHPYRPYEVDVGTMNGASLLGQRHLLIQLVAALREEGIGNVSHNWFAASRNQTITKFASARGVPSMQLEFSTTRIDPRIDDGAAHRFSQALQGLAEVLGKLGACARTNAKASSG